MTTATAQVPKEAAKGRKPNQKATVFVSGIAMGELGVYPSNKKPVSTIRVTEEALKSEEESSGASSGTRTGTRRQKGPEETAALPETMFLNVVQGKTVADSFELSGDTLAAYREFETGLYATHGLHMTKFIPAERLFGISHKNVFFLSPIAEVGETLKFYQGVHGFLSSHYRALIGKRVYKGNISPVAILAVEEGLVMWQLSEYDETHHITDAISGDWQGDTARMQPAETRALEALVERVSADGLTEDDVTHPLTTYQRELLRTKKASGEKPFVSKGPSDHGSLLEALQAAAAEG